MVATIWKQIYEKHTWHVKWLNGGNMTVTASEKHFSSKSKSDTFTRKVMHLYHTSWPSVRSGDHHIIGLSLSLVLKKKIRWNWSMVIFIGTQPATKKTNLARFEKVAGSNLLKICQIPLYKSHGLFCRLRRKRAPMQTHPSVRIPHPSPHSTPGSSRSGKAACSRSLGGTTRWHQAAFDRIRWEFVGGFFFDVNFQPGESPGGT